MNLPDIHYIRVMQKQAEKTITEKLKAINERLAENRAMIEAEWRAKCDDSPRLTIDEYRSLLNERGCH